MSCNETSGYHILSQLDDRQTICHASKLKKKKGFSCEKQIIQAFTFLTHNATHFVYSETIDVEHVKGHCCFFSSNSLFVWLKQSFETFFMMIDIFSNCRKQNLIDIVGNASGP